MPFDHHRHFEISRAGVLADLGLINGTEAGPTGEGLLLTVPGRSRYVTEHTNQSA